MVEGKVNSIKAELKIINRMPKIINPNPLLSTLFPIKVKKIPRIINKSQTPSKPRCALIAFMINFLRSVKVVLN